MLSDFFTLALETIVRRGLRSWLTMLGIFIGIASMVALISIGQGLQESIAGTFQSIGADIIMIMPGGGQSIVSSFAGLGSSYLTNHDLDLTKRANGVDIAGAMVYKMAKFEYGDEVKYFFVIGLPTDESRGIINSMQSFKLAEGRDLREGDRYVIDIGYLIAHGNVFEENVKIGDRLKVDGEEFRVIGSYEQIGSSEDDKQTYVTLDMARKIFNEPEKLSLILAKPKEGQDPSAVAENIKKELRRDRGLKAGEEDFTVQTMEQLLESVDVILGVVNIVVLGIAAISLLVGGIGIMNTMYTSVLEQTKNIGIMKAVGAQEHDIMMIFLFEAGILGLAGGVIGVLFGLGIGSLAEAASAAAGMSALKIYMSWELIIGSLLFSFVVGCVSGVAPAREAARLNPVDALRA
ncbi:MAG: ABC transporter permease [Candidatus Aenigmatarchaeota archaeon]